MSHCSRCTYPNFQCLSLIDGEKSLLCTACGFCESEHISYPVIVRLHNGVEVYYMMIHRGNTTSITSYMERRPLLPTRVKETLNEMIRTTLENDDRKLFRDISVVVSNSLNIYQKSYEDGSVCGYSMGDSPEDEARVLKMTLNVERPRDIVRIAMLRSSVPFDFGGRKGYPNNIVGVFWIPRPFVIEINYVSPQGTEYMDLEHDADLVRKIRTVGLSYGKKSPYHNVTESSKMDSIGDIITKHREGTYKEVPEITRVKLFGSMLMLSMIGGEKFCINSSFMDGLYLWIEGAKIPGMVCKFTNSCLVFEYDRKKGMKSRFSVRGNYVYEGPLEYVSFAFNNFVRLIRMYIKFSRDKGYLWSCLVIKDGWIPGTNKEDEE